METSRLPGPLVRRFVAGESLERGLAVAEKLNASGYLVALDHLGEKVTVAAEVHASAEAYHQAVEQIHRRGIRASVSIKLTQFGLDLSPGLCEVAVAELVARAAALGGAVEIDMESHEYVDRTLRMARAMHRRFGCVRAVIQAYLYRSEEDLLALCEERIPVRLCKGAYREPASVAFRRKRQVDASYARLTEILLDRGVNPALATHDPAMIGHALKVAAARGLGREDFEFQMLYGIRRDLQERLVGSHHRLRLYVPYGDAWYPYFMRRLAERPANLMFLARNLLHR